MDMRKLIMSAVCFTLFSHSYAQLNKYLIQLKNKNNSPFSLSNPSQFISQRAIDRRLKYQIPIDSTDLPINPGYITAIQSAGNVILLNKSKWLNQITIETTDNNAIALINNLPFVSQIYPIAAKGKFSKHHKHGDSLIIPESRCCTEKNTSSTLDYGLSFPQINIHQGQFLHNHGFRGEGMQIAVIDDGFYNYNQLITFDSIRNNNQILGTWDFVSQESNVEDDDSHGMHCLSTITANLPGSFVGTAPKSSVYLLRSEDIASEFPIEELNFAAAAEYADSSGVDLCTVSLGYSTFDDPGLNYTYAQMDGNTSISAKAADLATKKGMLMVIAAGNEGTNSWHYICTPSDADSVLCIGAVDTSGNTANFSSYGPSSDGQIKPSVAAVGKNAVVANSFSGLPGYGSGTSYACPIMAGMATCLWQAFPEANNMLIINALQLASSLSLNPNIRQGYGIPNMKKAFVGLQKHFASTQVTFSQCYAQIVIDLKTDTTMSIDIERKFPNESTYTLIKTIQCNEVFGLHHYESSNDLTGFPFQSVQYRYKVNIGNDTTFLLDSTTLHYNIDCTTILPEKNNLQIGPNPTNNLLNLSISRVNDTKVNYILFNVNGQKLFQKQVQQFPGTVMYPIDLSSMPKGVYILRVLCNDEKAIVKKIIRL